MNVNSITGDIIGVSLRQLGAIKVTEFGSHMHIVDFELDNGLKVSYVFNITKNDKYFLQRVRPYAMPHGKFASDKEIIEFITTDITRFRNASHSSNFGKFIKTTETGNELVYTMESLFLNHNVDKRALEEISIELDTLAAKVQRLHDNAEYIPLELPDTDGSNS